MPDTCGYDSSLCAQSCEECSKNPEKVVCPECGELIEPFFLEHWDCCPCCGLKFELIIYQYDGSQLSRDEGTAFSSWCKDKFEVK